MTRQFSPSVTEADILTALKSFLGVILPNGGATFTGTIAGATLTIATLQAGTLSPGDQVLGLGVVWGTTVLSGSGNSYQVSPSQSVPNPVQMSSGIAVIRGQDNRVPEPLQGDFATMTLIGMQRIATNVVTYADGIAAGSIAGTTMTVTAVTHGSITAGDPIFGPNVAANTRVVQQLTGTPGGVGTYQVTPSQTAAQGALYDGEQTHQQATEIIVQVDAFGPSSQQAAQLIATMFRDAYASDNFALSGIAVQPLYADDPRQLPFNDGEQQYENRWSIDLHLQANTAVATPQEFADQLTPTTIAADVVYPID